MPYSVDDICKNYTEKILSNYYFDSKSFLW